MNFKKGDKVMFVGPRQGSDFPVRLNQMQVYEVKSVYCTKTGTEILCIAHVYYPDYGEFILIQEEEEKL